MRPVLFEQFTIYNQYIYIPIISFHWQDDDDDDDEAVCSLHQTW